MLKREKQVKNRLQEFIEEWFPKTEDWENVSRFILESGVELTKEFNPKWLTGYTNIGISHKPHHKDNHTRYMEESIFMLHDVVHNIFTLEVSCSEEEYVKRQIYGELFTFYLTEFIIPQRLGSKHKEYFYDRGCLSLMSSVVGCASQYHKNIIDFMWDVFIDGLVYTDFERLKIMMKQEEVFSKYSKMFKEDLENSRKNFKFVPEGLKSYCMVGETSQNHIDFFEAVKKGVIKNIKREFNLQLPKEWI